MKKYFLFLFFRSLTGMLVYTNINLSSIKMVSRSLLKKKEYIQQINVSGEFEAKENTTIIMSSPLYIKDVFVTENSYVSKGQALFCVDKVMMKKLVNGEVSMDVSLYANNADIMKYLNNTSDLTTVIDTIPDTVYSPCNGIVTQLNIASGTVSMADEQLVSINPSDEIMAKFSLSQIDYGKISIGDMVQITPVAFANQRYIATITEDNAVIKKQNSLTGSKIVVDVFAHIKNPDNKIADGLQINGIVNLDGPREIKVIDYQYINQDSNGQFVFIYNNGIAQKHYIKTGIETGNFVEITTELPDKTIFLKGDIEEGDRVLFTIE